MKIIGDADKLESKQRVIGGLSTVIQVEFIFDFQLRSVYADTYDRSFRWSLSFLQPYLNIVSTFELIELVYRPNLIIFGLLGTSFMSQPFTNIVIYGSYIAGTNGYSNCIIPMLQAYDLAHYVDPGGNKWPRAFAIYIEPWHNDIFDFIDLRKNHGKEEAHAWDFFHAFWIPDLL